MDNNILYLNNPYWVITFKVEGSRRRSEVLEAGQGLHVVRFQNAVVIMKFIIMYGKAIMKFHIARVYPISRHN